MPNSSKKRPAALITGGARRIGSQIALALALNNYDIAITYNTSLKDAQKLQERIQKTGVNCKLFKVDLSKPKRLNGLITKVKKQFPNLNVLINNASIFKKGDLRKTHPAELEQNFAIHLASPLVLTQEFAQKCKKGNIINMLDTNVVKNRTTHCAYLLSKKSLLDLTRLAAKELAPDIRVNGIAPGLILPPSSKSQSYVKRLAKQIPLKHKGSVDNITQSVLFLLNNDFLTGQILFNDGGEHLL